MCFPNFLENYNIGAFLFHIPIDNYILIVDISALQDAAEAGDIAIVKMLADKDAEINAETSEGLTALHKASANGHAQVSGFTHQPQA